VHRQNSTWNRQELYGKVWRFPLRKLAAEYGISDVGLAKVCRMLEIALPGRRHWTRIDQLLRAPVREKARPHAGPHRPSRMQSYMHR
jgi:hypothetical protein